MHIENAQIGPIHDPKISNINENYQISQKIILLRNTVTFWQCAAK